MARRAARRARLWFLAGVAAAAACGVCNRLFVLVPPVALERRGGGATSRRAANGEACAGGAIETFLLRGPLNAAQLAAQCAPLANYFDLNCVTFLSMGVGPELIASVAGGALGFHGVCPVFIAEASGLVGWDREAKANVEMLEAELGGSGGEGVVVVAFRGGSHEPSFSDESGAALPEGKALHMVMRREGLPDKPPAGAVYGGLAKACYRLEHSGDLSPVDQFSVSTPFAVLSSFEGPAGQAASAAMDMLPPVARPPIAAGLFRGTLWGKDGAAALESLAGGELDGVRLFGACAHSIGPTSGETVICNPELMAWTSILDDDPRPEIELEPKKSVLALYGK